MIGRRLFTIRVFLEPMTFLMSQLIMETSSLGVKM